MLTTFPETTIPETTIPKIIVPTNIPETTIPISTIPNTIPKTIVPTTIPETTIPKLIILTTIPETTILETTFPKTTLLTTIPEITIPKTIVPTTIPETTIPKTIVPTTVPKTDIPETTIQKIIILTTIPETTIPKSTIPNTIPKTIVLTTIPETTIPKSTIPNTIPNTIVPTTIPKTTIPVTIPKTIVPTTIPKTTIPATIPSPPKSTSVSSIVPIVHKTTIIEATIPMPNNGTTQVVFLGYNNFQISEDLITFSTYFVPIQNELYSKELRFPMNITYDKNTNSYKETEAICTMKESNDNSKAQYSCEVHVDTSNIKEVKIDPEFNFTSQDNVEIIGVTPFARKFMNDIQSVDEKYESNIDSYVYLMNNSILYKIDDYSFDIYGLINSLQPRFDNKSLNLMINLYSEENTEIEAQCVFNKISGNNYSLHCESNETFDGYLQSAISFVDNGDIILVNFNNKTDSDISICNKTNNNNEFYPKNDCSCSSSLKPWEIGLLIGIPILAILACCCCFPFLFLCKRRKRRNRKSIEEIESTIKYLKAFK